MNLEERLDRIREGFEKQAPPEAVALMHRVTDDLRHSGMTDRTLKEGQKAPSFELENSQGSRVRLSALLAQGPVIITFFRGHWWPYCNAELDALNKIVDEFSKLGATLVAISPQLTAHSRSMIEQKKLKFEILHDPGNEIAHAYGLRWAFPDDLKQLYKQFGIDLAESNGEASWTLPLPARFIVNTKGLVPYARVDPDYTRRPEPQETLEALQGMAR